MTGKRLAVIVFGLFAFFGVLVARLYNIQVVNHTKYLSVAQKQQTTETVIPAERGEIVDRNGLVLSYTREDISLAVDKRMLKKKDIKILSTQLANVFDKSTDYYFSKISNGSKNIVLEEKVPKSLISSINAIKIDNVKVDALIIENDYSRVYPYGSIASHVIGYTNHTKTGTSGIEKVYNEFLKGENGKYKFEINGRNDTVSIDENNTVYSKPGADVQLTINTKYQKILEEELSNGLNDYNAKSAVGIIMAPSTGEILALANLPNYDPINYSLFDSDARRNRALTDPYEPGSTIKPIILSILLQEGLVNENDIINTENGSFRFAGATIRDTHPYRNMTIKEIIEHSSNIGMSKIIDKISKEKLYKYLRDFGFGNPTSIDLTGETKGLLKHPDNFRKLTQKFMSFGYQLSVTPIQLITAFSAIINGGYLNKPYIVNKIVSPDGNVIESFKPKRIRRIIDQVTSERVRSLMVGVVEDGTGTSARMEEMFVGGKTGTAQMIIDNEYSHQYYNSSFIGYFPAENPEVIMLVLYSAPEKGRYGSKVAAPVFKNIAERLIDSDIRLSSKKKKINRKTEAIKEFNIALLEETDKSNFAVYSNFTEESVKTKREFTSSSTMPNLKNFTVRDAIAQLSELGLKYEMRGKAGRVVFQSIPPGTKINSGEVCVIKCEKTKRSNKLRLN